MTMKRMKSNQVRVDWADVLLFVRAGGTVIVEHYNRPVARITPIKEPTMTAERHFIAWVTIAGVPTDVDPGITIVSGVLEDGVWHEDSSPVAETGDLPEGWGQDPNDPEDIDIDAVEAELARLGYQMADAGWQRSGQQWTARVEPRG